MPHFKIGIDLSIRSTGITINFGNKSKFIVVTDKISKKMMVRNGINIDYVLWERDNNKPENNIQRETIKTNNIYNIYNSIISSIKKHLLSDIPVMVNIEGISYGSSNTTSIIELAGLNYLIRCWCMSNKYQFNIIPPSQLKKFATGIGGADKDIMIESFNRLFPWGREEISKGVKLDDIADSYFLSQWQ